MVRTANCLRSKKNTLELLSKRFLLVPVILYVLITCHKNCGCLALRLVGRSKQHGLKFDRILKSQILKEWISLLGQRMHGKQVQVMRCQGAAAIDAVRKLSILLGLSNPNTPRTRRFGNSILRLQSQLALDNLRGELESVSCFKLI